MKKIVPFLVGILLTCTVFYSCSIINSLNNAAANGFICNNYSYLPVNSMDKQVTLSMIRNYYQKQYMAIHFSPTSGQKLVYFPPTINVDSRVVFFSLDTLKRLIYYTEKASKQFSQQDKQNLGLNVYFASYPDNMKMEIGGYDYTNRHTLIFIPSIFDNNSKIARDFDLKKSLSGINVSSPSYLDSAFFANPATNSIIAMAKVAADPQAPPPGAMNDQNHGTGTPPPYSKTGNAALDLTDH